MDKLIKYRQIIEQILTEYAAIPYSYGELEYKLIISQYFNSFVLMTMGWENRARVHGCLIHIDILDDKIWIQRDGTEDGIGNDLVKAGVPKDDIVPGFHPPELRKYVEYGVG